MEELLSEKESDSITNKCPNCGSSFAYDISTGKLKCDHCGTTQNIEKDDTVQRRAITDDIIKQGTEWKEASITTCNNCGAKEVIDKKDISRKCCFCNSSNIVVSADLPGIKPDSVIPFQITKDSAVDRFRHWIKSRILAPKLFKTSDIREHINAVYSPCWSFSAHTENYYQGVLGKHVHTTTRNSQGQMVQTTKTNWFRVKGQINENYSDYFVQSGDRIPSISFNRLKPFDLKLLTVYRQEYLSGIIAEHYSRTLDICFGDFSNFVRMDIRQKIMRRHNADVVQSIDIQTNYKNRRFNYILLPLYIATYVYNNKTFNFYVNGASGLVVGGYPKSKLKIGLIVTSVILAIVAIGVIAFFVTK